LIKKIAKNKKNDNSNTFYELDLYIGL